MVRRREQLVLNERDDVDGKSEEAVQRCRATCSFCTARVARKRLSPPSASPLVTESCRWKGPLSSVSGRVGGQAGGSRHLPARACSLQHARWTDSQRRSRLAPITAGSSAPSVALGDVAVRICVSTVAVLAVLLTLRRPETSVVLASEWRVGASLTVRASCNRKFPFEKS